jgi:hypothetical protein
MLHKVLPKVYGDKLTVPGDPNAPPFKQAIDEINQMSEPELAALKRFTEAVIAGFSPSNGIATENQKSRQSRRPPHEARGAGSISTSRMT